MKKFSKLILELGPIINKQKGSEKDLFKKHPLVNPVDWDEVFKPLIEHINSNLKENVPPPGDGVFNDETKKALIKFMESVTSDYVEYYKSVIDDGSQESFFNAYDINIEWEDLMDCIQHLLDRTDNVNDYPNWEEGKCYVQLVDLKFNNTNELLEDIIDVFSKLKMYNVNFNIKLLGGSDVSFGKNRIKGIDITDKMSEENTIKSVKNFLDVNNKEFKQMFPVMSIIIYNDDTVQDNSKTDTYRSLGFNH